LKQERQAVMTASIEDGKKICPITGGTKGVGKETALVLAVKLSKDLKERRMASRKKIACRS